MNGSRGLTFLLCKDPSGFCRDDEWREQDWTDEKARLSQWQWALFLLSLFIKMVALGSGIKWRVSQTLILSRRRKHLEGYLPPVTGECVKSCPGLQFLTEASRGPPACACLPLASSLHAHHSCFFNLDFQVRKQRPSHGGISRPKASSPVEAVCLNFSLSWVSCILSGALP